MCEKIIKPFAIPLKKMNVSTNQEGLQSMDIPINDTPQQQEQKKMNKSKAIRFWLLVLNCAFLAIGQVGGPLLLRLYYLHGGQRKWLTSWLQTAAFPILLFPISISYVRQRPAGGQTMSIFPVSLNLFLASAFIGFLFALDSYLYSFGLSYLPVSTSTLLLATQTVFIAVFSFLIVKQKFTFYSINSVAVMTVGTVVLSLHASSDRPSNVSNGKYYSGFSMTLAAAAVLGIIMPLIEVAYSKVSKVITFHLVMQMQFLVSMFATIYCTIVMLINKDFQAISKEATEYGLGAAKYYTVLVCAALLLQLMVIGNMGVIFCSSSLFSGIFIAFLVPVQQVSAVIFFHERFNGDKGLALALCIWGLVSYFYGEYKRTKVVTVTETERQNPV